MRQCGKKVSIEGRVAGVFRSLVNARGLQLECVKAWFFKVKSVKET